MRVTDLVGKQFQNVKLKGADSYDKLAAAQRRNKSITHQLDVLKAREAGIIIKLAEKGIAYTRDDPRYERARTNLGTHQNFYLGIANKHGYYCDVGPQHEALRKHMYMIFARERDLKKQLEALARSMKGLKSAMTRKRRRYYI